MIIFNTQLRRVFKFALEKRYIKHIPHIPTFSDSEMIRKTHKIEKDVLKTMFKNADLNAIKMYKLNNMKIPLYERKQKFALYFFMYSGVRPNEFVNLKSNQIDLKRGTIDIVSVNPRKPGRLLPIHKNLRRILNVFWPYIQGRQYINPWETKYGAYLAIKRLGRLSGSDNPVSLRSLRKTFASRLAESGAPLFYHSKIMGHSIKTSEKHYVELETERLRDQINTLKI